jgi:hypothetical protein
VAAALLCRIFKRSAGRRKRGFAAERGAKIQGENGARGGIEPPTLRFSGRSEDDSECCGLRNHFLYPADLTMEIEIFVAERLRSASTPRALFDALGNPAAPMRRSLAGCHCHPGECNDIVIAS